MKSVARILIVFFIAFLSTPTIVTLIENNTDVSMFYNYSEEEIYKDFKEIKADLRQNFDYPFIEFKHTTNSKIISENLSKYDNVSEEIFSPPPKLI
jgi:hypothetical protein